MSAFNTVHATVTCPVCHEAGMFDVQFKFGDTWQYEYQLGDTLRWGGNDYGARSVLARIDGIGGPCPNCSADNVPFTIILNNDRLEAVMPQSMQDIV